MTTVYRGCNIVPTFKARAHEAVDKMERWETAAGAMAKVIDRGTAEAFALLVLDDVKN